MLCGRMPNKLISDDNKNAWQTHTPAYQPATIHRFRFKPLPAGCLFYRPGLITERSNARDKTSASTTAALNSKCKGAAFQTECKRKTEVQGIQPNAHGEACCAHHDAKHQGLTCSKTARGTHNGLALCREELTAVRLFKATITQPAEQGKTRTL